MKKFVLIGMAAFLMGGMAMAQQPENRDDKRPDPKVRAERMTERMVEEYSLNDTQKKQLLEANLELTEKMGDRPMRRRADMRKGRRDNGCCCCCDKKRDAKARKHQKADKRQRLTDEERAQKKTEMDKKHEEMKQARASYDLKLQKIMTKEQYASYSQKMKDRKAKMESKRK